MKTVSSFKRRPPKVPKVAKRGVLKSYVKEFRDKHGLTLRDVSQGSQVPLATLLRMQYGCEVELTKALLLAKFFETDVNSLFSLR